MAHPSEQWLTGMGHLFRPEHFGPPALLSIGGPVVPLYHWFVPNDACLKRAESPYYICFAVLGHHVVSVVPTLSRILIWVQIHRPPRSSYP